MTAVGATDPTAATERAADERVLATVIRETRAARRRQRLRALAVVAIAVGFAALTPIAALRGWLVGAMAAAGALALVRVIRAPGRLPPGPLSLFDGRHEIGHVTFSGPWLVYATVDGRRVHLAGATARGPDFRQALRRRFPEVPQPVSILPAAP